MILKNSRKCIRLPNCVSGSRESVSTVQGLIWEAFYWLRYTDSLSKCVRHRHLTFCFSILCRLPGGNVLMSYLPAWVMISRSWSSCCVRNNEESQREGDQDQFKIYWDTAETSTRPIRKTGVQTRIHSVHRPVEKRMKLALNFWMATSA